LTLTAARIRELLELLNTELAAESVRGEVYLAVGAVMCLVFRAREATKAIDALLVPAAELRRAVQRIGERESLTPGWFNDAVKVSSARPVASKRFRNTAICGSTLRIPSICWR
jgi:hypothetical protein